MPFQAALFDLDGTLLDSLGDIAACCNDALSENGFPTQPLEAYNTLVGDGAHTLVERALGSQASNEAVTRVLNRFRDLYAIRWHEQSALYEGISEMLDGLADRGMTLMILSNKPDGFTCDIVEHFFKGWSFVWVHGAREGIPLKPNAQAALEAASFAQLAPEHMLYIGDTSTDMKTAVNANMCGVGVTWGFRDRAELKAHGARYIIDAPLDLLPLVESA